MINKKVESSQSSPSHPSKTIDTSNPRIQTAEGWKRTHLKKLKALKSKNKK